MNISAEPHQNNIDWQNEVSSWRRSGLPMTLYCQQHDLNTHQLGYYKRKFESLSTQSTVTTSGFTQVAMSNIHETQSLTLRLSSGHTIEGISSHNMTLATSLAKALS